MMGGWKALEATGVAPAARGGHSSVVVNNQLLLFGGADRTSRTYADLWALSLDKEGSPSWTSISAQLPADVAIKGRAGAALVAIGNIVYMFGGQDPSSGLCFNDLLQLDTTSWTWSRVVVEGRSPPARHSCCAVPFREQCMLVFGGAGLQSALSDTWVFDAMSCTWTRPTTTGSVPVGREMAGAVLLGGERLAVMGGRAADGRVLDDLCILDCHTWKWEQEVATGLPRCAHTLALLPTAAGAAAQQDAHKQRQQQEGKLSTKEAAGKTTAAAAEVAADINGLTLDQQPTTAGATATAADPGAPAAASSSSSKAEAAPAAAAGGSNADEPAAKLLIYGGFSGMAVEGGVYELDCAGGKVRCVCESHQQPQRSSDAGAGASKSGAPPAARFAHAAGVLQHGKQQVLLVHGGVNPEADLDDVAMWCCT